MPFGSRTSQLSGINGVIHVSMDKLNIAIFKTHAEHMHTKYESSGYSKASKVP